MENNQYMTQKIIILLQESLFTLCLVFEKENYVATQKLFVQRVGSKYLF